MERKEKLKAVVNKSIKNGFSFEGWEKRNYRNRLFTWKEQSNLYSEVLSQKPLDKIILLDIDFAKQGYLVADITYPDKTSGQLIYVKTTLTDNLPVDIMRYKNSHSDFPDETTIDQFFDENQFEAYRRLGMHIAQPILNDQTINWC